MKKIIALFIVCSFICSVTPVFAQPNAKAYENAQSDNFLDEAGDWFATVGKSDIEKAKIKAERKAKRTAKKAEKKAEKAAKMAEKKAGDMKNKAKGWQKEGHKGSKK